MAYKYKYLVGEIGAKAEELWEQYPEVMDAVGHEAVRAWKIGYRQGASKTITIAMLMGAAMCGGVTFAINKIEKHVKAKATEE